MKRALSLVTFAVLFTSIAAFANSNTDPRIIIKDPVCGKHCTPVGTNFTFTSPKKGNGTLFFTNTSGVNWISLKLVETGVIASDITCSAPHTFKNCSVTTNKKGVTTILLSGVGPGFGGITTGHSFEISFAKWPVGGVNFTATASAVPEPATLALLGTGLCAIAVRRRKLLRPR